MLKRSASEGPEEELGEQLDNSSQQALQRAKQCTDPSGCFICAAQESSQWRTLLAGGPHICNPCGLLLARVMRREEENGQQFRAFRDGQPQQRRTPRLRWDEVGSEKRQALITALRDGVADRDRREASRQALEAAAQARRVTPGLHPAPPQYTAPLVAASTLTSSRSAPVLPAVTAYADSPSDCMHPRIPAVVQVPATSTSLTITGSQLGPSRSQSPPPGQAQGQGHTRSMSICTASAAAGKQSTATTQHDAKPGGGPGTPTRRGSLQGGSSSSSATGVAPPASSATQYLQAQQARTEGSRLLGLLRQRMSRSSGGGGGGGGREAPHIDMEAAEVLLMMGGNEDASAAHSMQMPLLLQQPAARSAAPPVPDATMQQLSASTIQHELHTQEHGAVAFVSVSAAPSLAAKPVTPLNTAPAGLDRPATIPSTDVQPGGLASGQGPHHLAPPPAAPPVLVALPATAAHRHASVFTHIPLTQATSHTSHLYAPPSAEPPAPPVAPPPPPAPGVSTLGAALLTTTAPRSHPSLPSILLADALLAELAPAVPQLAPLPQLDCCSAISQWLASRGLHCSTDPQHAWVGDMVMLAVSRDIALIKQQQYHQHHHQQLLQVTDGARLLHT